MLELPSFLEYLKISGHEVETIVVNDGSDNSVALARFCSSNGFKLINHDGNRGKGAAVRTGMLAASRAIRVFTDADIPFQYDTIDAILSQFKDAAVSVVAGDRRKSDYFAKTPLTRRMGSRVFSGMVDLIMLRPMGDTQCGIKGFRDNCIEEVFAQSKQTGFAADIEWLYRAQRCGFMVHTVSAEFRNAGQSSVVLWKHALPMLLDVLKIRFS